MLDTLLTVMVDTSVTHLVTSSTDDVLDTLLTVMVDTSVGYFVDCDG